MFLNPEPIADFVDLFLIGEGEEMVPEFIARFRETDALDGSERLRALAAVDGAYLPDYFRRSTTMPAGSRASITAVPVCRASAAG